MSCSELQSEELEVLKSIYEGDDAYSAIEDTVHQYKVWWLQVWRSFFSKKNHPLSILFIFLVHPVRDRRQRSLLRVGAAMVVRVPREWGGWGLPGGLLQQGGGGCQKALLINVVIRPRRGTSLSRQFCLGNFLQYGVKPLWEVLNLTFPLWRNLASYQQQARRSGGEDPNRGRRQSRGGTGTL